MDTSVKEVRLVPYITKDWPNMVFWVTPEERANLLKGIWFIRVARKISS